METPRRLEPFEGQSPQKEYNVLNLHKGDEQYFFLFEDEVIAQTIDQFRKYAMQTDLSFNWFDCVVLTDKAQKQVMETLKKS